MRFSAYTYVQSRFSSVIAACLALLHLLVHTHLVLHMISAAHIVHVHTRPVSILHSRVQVFRPNFALSLVRVWDSRRCRWWGSRPLVVIEMALRSSVVLTLATIVAATKASAIASSIASAVASAIASPMIIIIILIPSSVSRVEWAMSSSPVVIIGLILV